MEEVIYNVHRAIAIYQETNLDRCVEKVVRIGQELHLYFYFYLF